MKSNDQKCVKGLKDKTGLFLSSEFDLQCGSWCFLVNSSAHQLPVMPAHQYCDGHTAFIHLLRSRAKTYMITPRQQNKKSQKCIAQKIKKITT
jgi:hypothetical protein